LQDPSLSDSAYSNLLRIFLWQFRGDKDPSRLSKVLAEVLGSSQAFRYRRIQKVRFEMFDFRDWAFDGTTFDEAVLSFCILPRGYKEALRHSRGVSIIECSWFPEEGLAEEAIEKAKESLRRVLRRFVMSTDPVKVRN